MTVDRKRLRELALTATPGPWHPHDTPGGWALRQVVRAADDTYVTRVNHGLSNWRENREFIAAANPQTILELLDALDAAEQPEPDAERVEKLERALHFATDDMDWSGGDRDGMPECPWCRGKPETHDTDCQLLAARRALADD